MIENVFSFLVYSAVDYLKNIDLKCMVNIIHNSLEEIMMYTAVCVE